MPADRLPERLTPLASRRGLRAHVGDLHNHCALSYGHGSLARALANAHRQLDFVSVTGHAYWPDMPVDDPRVAHIVAFHVEGFARLDRLWPGHFETLARFHEPRRFTVFPGYEMHSSAHGDYTIVLRDLDQRARPCGDTPDALLAALRDAYGTRAMAFPHHLAYRTGARGVNWASFSEALSPVVEMVSMHGSAETSITDRPFLHSMGPGDGPNTIHHGLNAGHMFGVLGNTDHHSGYPGSYGHGRSTIYANENTAEALWSALHARHTNALTGDNVHLFATLGDAMQGDVVAPTGDAVLEVEAVAGGFIDAIDVIRNGALAARVTPALSPSPIEETPGALETLLVLELGWGARGHHHDWTGRIALEGGEVLGLEPRLRGPEVVSPLEGDGQGEGEGEGDGWEDRIARDGAGADFAVRAHANPNNVTPAMQGLAMRVRLRPGAEIALELDGHDLRVSAERLLAGAVSGNLGPIDSPAYRLLPLPRPRDWQWTGQVSAGPLAPGDWLMLRLRQAGGQYAWTSPFFCR